MFISAKCDHIWRGVTSLYLTEWVSQAKFYLFLRRLTEYCVLCLTEYMFDCCCSFLLCLGKFGSTCIVQSLTNSQSLTVTRSLTCLAEYDNVWQSLICIKQSLTASDDTCLFLAKSGFIYRSLKVLCDIYTLVNPVIHYTTLK